MLLIFYNPSEERFNISLQSYRSKCKSNAQPPYNLRQRPMSDEASINCTKFIK